MPPPTPYSSPFTHARTPSTPHYPTDTRSIRHPYAPGDTRTYQITISEHPRQSESFFFPVFFFFSFQDRHTAKPYSNLRHSFTNPRPLQPPRRNRHFPHHAETSEEPRTPLPMPTPFILDCLRTIGHSDSAPRTPPSPSYATTDLCRTLTLHLASDASTTPLRHPPSPSTLPSTPHRPQAG